MEHEYNTESNKQVLTAQARPTILESAKIIIYKHSSHKDCGNFKLYD
jgi:hypothetical protein